MATQPPRIEAVTRRGKLAARFLSVHPNDAVRSVHIDSIPRAMVEPMLCYLVFGDPMSGFPTALVAGDFFRAALNADGANFPALGHFARWIGFCWPTESYGTYDKVNTWTGLANQTFDDDDLAEDGRPIVDDDNDGETDREADARRELSDGFGR